ncbi:MAG: proline racemase family protein [Acidobacteriaceae bacterium]|nr:proline racemase family protein [Acidobacteriaceae bacterium]
MAQHKIHVIDSHTGGEPTRIVVSGGPPLRRASVAEQLDEFRSKYDHWRSAIVNEPRGSDAIVGAVLCEPEDETCSTGVIFFNNVGYLAMCGHGTIGLGVTLQYLQRIKPGAHRFETPVGVVDVLLHDENTVTVRNVASYQSVACVSVEVDGFGKVTGDIAWGGNWFFLTYDVPFELLLSNLHELSNYAWRIRRALVANGITGADGKEIDHIELFGCATMPGADSKNFVLCPGGSYDRSPCGTGTSAKLACLYADGKLKEGEIWRQESLIGSIFEASFTLRGGLLYPSIKGSAYVTADAQIIVDDEDPFAWGIAGSGQQTLLRGQN